MKRHELREQVFRLLFRVEFHTPEEMPEQMRLFVEDSEEITVQKDADYVTQRYEQIQEHLTVLDQTIGDNTEGWDITRMGKVELTVLRLACYEILYDEEIPASVAINEAVDIAKAYGQENAGGFVNAILSKIVKQGESHS